MSVKIVQKPLPAGVVPYEEIADPVMKQKVMLLNRNIASLAAQLAECQRAAIELQQRPMPKQKEIEDIEQYVAQAAASANAAAGSATSAGQSASAASTAATNAGASATAAGTSETNAANSATAANGSKVAAEGARDEAVPAAQTATDGASTAVAAAARAEAAARLAEWSTGFVLAHNVALTYADSGVKHAFPMSAFVPDTSLNYDVSVTFHYWNSSNITGNRYFTVNGITKTEEGSSAAPITQGHNVTVETTISGAEDICVINGASSSTGTAGTAQWDVMVRIRKHQTT